MQPFISQSRPPQVYALPFSLSSSLQPPMGSIDLLKFSLSDLHALAFKLSKLQDYPFTGFKIDKRPNNSQFGSFFLVNFL